MSSFENDGDTTPWDNGAYETVDTIVLDKDTFEALKEDSNILYALRKMGFVTAGQEAAAVEFLEGEDIDV